MHMINQNLCQNEAENRSTEHPKSYENKTVCASDGSMHEIRSDSTGKEWIDIGGAKKWVRRCPSCGVSILYKSLVNRVVGDGKNSTCKDCYNKSIRKYQTPDKLVRNCPGCGKEIEYTKGKDLSVRRHYWLRDTRENRLCRKCVKTGTNNGMYGTHRIGKLNPNFGKNWTGEKKNRAREISKTAFIKRKLNGNLNRHGTPGRQGNWYNKVGCQFIDAWAIVNGYNMQHAMRGGEFYYMHYFADGYDANKNVWFEYDETHHYFKTEQLKPKDIDRTIKILQNLKCRFVRYNERAKKLYECRISNNNPSELQYAELSVDGISIPAKILSE